MRLLGALLGLMVAATAHAEVKPQAVDLKPVRAKTRVFADANKNYYVLVGGAEDKDRRLFFGDSKGLYEQRIVGFTRNGDQWSIDTWAPRLPDIHPAYFTHRADDTFEKSCDGKDDAVLTELTGDKAKAVLDLKIMTELLVQRPHMLARDDAGVYYYVDRLAEKYGGKGYRVFVGKKGAVVQLDLTDIATDTAGDVFSTKSGDLRLTRTNTEGGHKVVWVKGEKRTELFSLDVDANSPVIFRELGVYKFTGTLCDNI